jgi:hypothetical protein
MIKQNNLNNKLFEMATEGNLSYIKTLIENGCDIHAGEDYALRLSAKN